MSLSHVGLPHRYTVLVFMLPVSCLPFYEKGAKGQKVPKYVLVDYWIQSRVYDWEKIGVCVNVCFIV